MKKCKFPLQVVLFTEQHSVRVYCLALPTSASDRTWKRSRSITGWWGVSHFCEKSSGGNFRCRDLKVVELIKNIPKVPTRKKIRSRTGGICGRGEWYLCRGEWSYFSTRSSLTPVNVGICVSKVCVFERFFQAIAGPIPRDRFAPLSIAVRSQCAIWTAC